MAMHFDGDGDSSSTTAPFVDDENSTRRFRPDGSLPVADNEEAGRLSMATAGMMTMDPDRGGRDNVMNCNWLEWN